MHFVYVIQCMYCACIFLLFCGPLGFRNDTVTLNIVLTITTVVWYIANNLVSQYKSKWLLYDKEKHYIESKMPWNRRRKKTDTKTHRSDLKYKEIRRLLARKEKEKREQAEDIIQEL